MTQKYNLTVPVMQATGTQYWAVEADSPEEAIAVFRAGGGGFVGEEIAVVELGEPEVSDELQRRHAGNATVHRRNGNSPIDIWRERALKAEAKLAKAAEDAGGYGAVARVAASCTQPGE